MRAIPSFFTVLITSALLIFSSSCSEDPVSTVKPSPVVKTNTVIVGEIGPFWPTLIGGDCEFDGHGPLVTLKARLYVEANVLLCYVYMYARETESNWSTAEGSWDELLYIAPSGWRITYTGVHPDSCQTQYIDSKNNYDYTGCPGFAFRSIGDTVGEDICNTTLDNTHVYLRLDTLFVGLQEI